MRCPNCQSAKVLYIVDKFWVNILGVPSISAMCLDCQSHTVLENLDHINFIWSYCSNMNDTLSIIKEASTPKELLAKLEASE